MYQSTHGPSILHIFIDTIMVRIMKSNMGVLELRVALQSIQ